MNNKIIKFLTKLKNGYQNNYLEIITPFHKEIFDLVKCLYKEGLILSYSIILQKKKLYSTKQMWIYLWRCNSETPFFSTLKIVSTPSKKYFCKFWELVCIPLKQRVYFFSTVWGFKTLYDCKKERLGGIFCFSC